MLALTEQTGELLQRSITEARMLAAGRADAGRAGVAPTAKRRAAARSEELADRCEKVASQIRQRVQGEPITDRLVSLADPDARPIRKGKLGKPNEFGYVSQICEVTENTRRGARGLIVPASTRLGQPRRGHAAARHDRRASTGSGSDRGRSRSTVASTSARPARRSTSTSWTRSGCSSPAASNPGSRRTQRRLQRYRTGTEGRISHLKRGYGLDRSRLKGDEGRQIWTGWGILAYNADTLAIRTR